MEQIREVPIDSVKPYENNPRDNDGAVEATANSIKEFGWQQPIVVDKDMVVIAGHTRLKAAKQLGLKHVPIVVADLSEEQAKAYRLADNKTGELADWIFLI
ncbi:ParB N-terminal domain-containing protein [Limosilactobacillus mucosae]|uniref:ParB N-terminal domain-containing protein n=1 Tax=Limosilactobacillus mucosae TaxID=97478 RepID=UPI001F04E36C|nr:ParB N-terminal domain-containing protein [Limosilactobacillus mucosae]